MNRVYKTLCTQANEKEKFGVYTSNVQAKVGSVTELITRGKGKNPEVKKSN